MISAGEMMLSRAMSPSLYCSPDPRQQGLFMMRFGRIHTKANRAQNLWTEVKFSKVRVKNFVIALRIFVNGVASSGKRLLIQNLDSNFGRQTAGYWAIANLESSIVTFPIISPILSINGLIVRG